MRLRWYVFGAQAVAVHGHPRATADLDLTVDLGELAPTELVERLGRVGFVARFDDPAFIRATRVIPLVHTRSRIPVDVVIAGPGLEQLFIERAARHRVGTIEVPVISREHLIVTKLLASRPKDLEDVRELIAVSGDELAVDEIEDLLDQLEQALGQSDLRARFRELRRR
jgi:hypothetical protein